jgi:hypothetical protein
MTSSRIFPGELVDLDRREGEPDLFGERVRSRWKP